MNKGLIYAAGGMAFLGLIGFKSVHYDEYIINGNKVKDGQSVFNDLIEFKGEDKIRYVMSLKNEDLGKVVVNGKRFNEKDILVYEEAAKRYYSIKQEIQEIKDQRKNSSIEKKLVPEEQLKPKTVASEIDKETEEALEILRK